MRVIGADEIRRRIGAAAAIAAMRDAVLAHARGECDTPMPMHLDLSAAGGGEVHVKSSYRRGGRHVALKVAGTYAERPYGSIALISAATGETVAHLDDGGYLTDLRTAAVAALVARELGRADRALGILGPGPRIAVMAATSRAPRAGRRGGSVLAARETNCGLEGLSCQAFEQGSCSRSYCTVP